MSLLPELGTPDSIIQGRCGNFHAASAPHALRRRHGGTAKQTETGAAEMTYEEYLDEVTTLMTERYDLSDEDAIKHVMRAQAADFFTLHDDHPEMRTQERAEQDAKTIFEQRNKSRPHTPPKRTGQKGK
jgi:hypothetical protein